MNYLFVIIALPSNAIQEKPIQTQCVNITTIKLILFTEGDSYDYFGKQDNVICMVFLQ